MPRAAEATCSASEGNSCAADTTLRPSTLNPQPSTPSPHPSAPSSMPAVRNPFRVEHPHAETQRSGPAATLGWRTERRWRSEEACPQSREGRPEIAHRFIGGNQRANGPESCQGRKKAAKCEKEFCRPWRDLGGSRTGHPSVETLGYGQSPCRAEELAS